MFEDSRRGRHQPLPLGQIVATPGALAALAAAGEDPAAARAAPRPRRLGDLDEHDRTINRQALLVGAQVLSAYRLSTGEKLWVITKWDRSVTTLLLPVEYCGAKPMLWRLRPTTWKEFGLITINFPTIRAWPAGQNDG